MFLKSLTLKGFKSFADTAALKLEPGVTVVVGPNGSGKSNVVDAIAWVLGAQAPSAVRSQKMDDVIFAGTSSRPALGRAEVGLTIDNSAGLLPIEFTEVTVTRTLFRTGESEYAINGAPCRLLDVQELLSDTGVGRQQHVIVSQGQIDAVLNARPEERRSIVEEAAGVLKHRKRKERAERKLEATEANLLRLQDLLREVRRQLRPLEKQAEAARRHGDLVTELRALQLFLAGREITQLQSRLANGAAERTQLTTAEADQRAALARLDAEVLSAEGRLGGIGGRDLSDVLPRCEALRERARGLTRLLAERRRSIERDKGALMDAGVVANLEAEAARLGDELLDCEREAASLVPRATEVADAEAELAAERDAFEAAGADHDGRAAVSGAAAAAEVRGELAAVRNTSDRGSQEHGRLLARLTSLEERAARLNAQIERFRAEHQQAEDSEAPLLAEHDEAEEALTATQAALDAITANVAELASERASWRARADALGLALDEARARAGAERLAGLRGVVGTLLELVDVDEGWEAAFEAAAGEALAAVIVAGSDDAKAALAHLQASGARGAVLALGAARPMASPVASSATAGRPVRAHVRSADAGVAALLDVLLGAAVVVDGGWTAAVDVALAHPGAVVVTADGDRFGPAGWRIGASGSGATGAALEEARTKADAADEAWQRAEADRQRAVAGLAAARQRAAEVAKRLDANDSRFTAASDGLARVHDELRGAAAETESVRQRMAELAERAERDQARLAELTELLPALEAAESEEAERARARQLARQRLDQKAAAVASLRRDLEVRAAGVEERLAFLRRRRTEVEDRLKRDAIERARAEERRVRLDRALVAVDRLSALVAEHTTAVEAQLEELHEERRRQSEAVRAVTLELNGLRAARQAAEKELEVLRERARRAELDEAEVRLRLESTVEALRRDHDVEPAVAQASECPPLPGGQGLALRVKELERELRLLGPINPLALEEFTALSERHTFLEEQLDDVRTTRRELAKVITAVDKEIQQVFGAAFADVERHFEHLFATLFPGGTGRLHLTQPENLLDTGIEVEAKPSGKNVKKLSLLSGGERSLTALAFLFAVFRSRPSPFYVMDEVEAALDDVNLHRFLGLIDEFRKEAQLIIVSHQRRTMEAADCLYGVTMAPGGSSKVVSERVTAKG